LRFATLRLAAFLGAALRFATLRLAVLFGAALRFATLRLAVLFGAALRFATLFLATLFLVAFFTTVIVLSLTITVTHISFQLMIHPGDFTSDDTDLNEKKSTIFLQVKIFFMIKNSKKAVQ